MGGRMLSFRLKGGRQAAYALCKNTKTFTSTESLGEVASLCEVPAGMTRGYLKRGAREFGCGIEVTQNFIIDVLQARKTAVMATSNGVL
ncbi:cystathionine gamma-lyase [Penicillium argentinense]|uniref:Cystathionine gamma-lyase n=1 Tax=Penicillium argentinense TaxID=1131581 RepID=A0A9W9EIR5_9EURO|nr:cystathionine gamma-lyase [Penicillium argentinense]KAJ5082451.1 cystathionine gamma-lyase [Penicillium argentinense]